MSQHENPSGSQSQAPSHDSGVPVGYQPSSSGAQPPAPYAPPGAAQPSPPKQRNVIGLIALIVAIVGFIFACIPGALIVGWVLLPIAFILSIVSFFQRGKGKALGIAALIVSVVGTIVGVVVFLAVVAASFNDAFSDETTAVAPSSEAVETEPAAAPPAEDEAEDAAGDAAAEGTRENPLPLGSTISSDEWTVTVDAHNAAADEIVAANQFNEPAPEGSHYEIVTYTVTYTGTESGFAASVGLDLVTDSGNVINSFDTIVLLEDSIGLDELFEGASTTGSAAFVVPDNESTLIRVTPGILAEEMFVQP